jgi:hypothetical protein
MLDLDRFALVRRRAVAPAAAIAAASPLFRSFQALERRKPIDGQFDLFVPQMQPQNYFFCGRGGSVNERVFLGQQAGIQKRHSGRKKSR